MAGIYSYKLTFTKSLIPHHLTTSDTITNPRMTRSTLTYTWHIIVDNGLVRLTISKPQGLLTAIKYGGIDNLLDLKSNELSRGYWDINWNLPGGQDRYQLLRGSEYSVINFSNDHLEVSFKSTYDPSTPGTRLPLTVDLRSTLTEAVYFQFLKHVLLHFITHFERPGTL
ncbi:hypothetical protein Pfo_023224 [Paulownia fortunei]|nr:hypothetical protein Pfo_023224 [Paulownia fortunei]